MMKTAHKTFYWPFSNNQLNAHLPKPNIFNNRTVSYNIKVMVEDCLVLDGFTYLGHVWQIAQGTQSDSVL